MSASGATAVVMKNRIVSAIRGAFTADAACLGTHWIYNPREMAAEVPSLEAPEFKDPPTPRFYSAAEFPGHYGPGMLSPYGEQLLFVTEYVAYGNPVEGQIMSENFLDWAETFGGRPDHATKQFVENMKKEDGSGKWPNCGADDDQAHIYMKIVPVTCLYAGKPELTDKVTEAIRVHQNNNKAVGFGLAAAYILEGVLLGDGVEEAINKVHKKIAEDKDMPEQELVLQCMDRAETLLSDHADLDAVLLELSHEKMKDQPDSSFYDLAARSCALPGSFIGPLYLFHKAAMGKKYGDDMKGWYAAAMRENILAAGDTCSRAVFVGAVLGAAAETVPGDWTDRVHAETYAKVEIAANNIAELATSSSSVASEL